MLSPFGRETQSGERVRARGAKKWRAGSQVHIQGITAIGQK